MQGYESMHIKHFFKNNDDLFITPEVSRHFKSCDCRWFLMIKGSMNPSKYNYSFYKYLHLCFLLLV